MARKIVTESFGPYTAIITQFTFSHFLVVKGRVLKIISPILSTLDLSEDKELDIGDMDLGKMVDAVFTGIKPEDLPGFFRDLMADTKVMGPDPMDGGRACADLSPISLDEILGEDPMMGYKMAAAILKLNFIDFLAKAGINLKGVKEKMASVMSGTDQPQA